LVERDGADAGRAAGVALVVLAAAGRGAPARFFAWGFFEVVFFTG